MEAGLHFASNVGLTESVGGIMGSFFMLLLALVWMYMMMRYMEREREAGY